MKLYRLNRILHRDLGYFFFGMIIVYAISGVALNHRHQWNPNYIIRQETIRLNLPDSSLLTRGKEYPEAILEQVSGNLKYRTHLSSAGTLKIFVDGGSLTVNLNSGEGKIETIRKRPILNGFNFLHYNKPGKMWTWFSDIFCVGLLFLAISGLFIIKGKNGIKGRAIWMTATGAIVTFILFLVYAV